MLNSCQVPVVSPLPPVLEPDSNDLPRPLVFHVCCHETALDTLRDRGLFTIQGLCWTYSNTVLGFLPSSSRSGCWKYTYVVERFSSIWPLYSYVQWTQIYLESDWPDLQTKNFIDKGEFVPVCKVTPHWDNYSAGGWMRSADEGFVRLREGGREWANGRGQRGGAPGLGQVIFQMRSNMWDDAS